MRRLLALFLLIAIAPLTLLRDPPLRPSWAQQMSARPLPEPPLAARQALLGAFRLEGAWQLSSPHALFGGYSALVPLSPGHFLAISDKGQWLDFTAPGVTPPAMRIGSIFPVTRASRKQQHDIESATRDPRSGTIWFGWEGPNAISRHAPDLTMQARVRPQAMQGWYGNTGPESMVRLADGRFVVLCEGFTSWLGGPDHEAVVFSGDPTRGGQGERFTFAGADGFRPTDMAQLPDGRVLVLMRRMLWPLPLRFAGRIMLADPAQIRSGKVWQAREVARLEAPLLIDNFEGMAVEPQGDRTVRVWLISDDNDAVTQRTLLWQLRLDPKDLPPR
ncbi:MAG: esterase-like activity of phytase family protein [Sphingomonadales bacterium]|nr:esterase-like activity of phytase family protein [Sphingomonadales bacterium]